MSSDLGLDPQLGLDGWAWPETNQSAGVGHHRQRAQVVQPGRGYRIESVQSTNNDTETVDAEPQPIVLSGHLQGAATLVDDRGHVTDIATGQCDVGGFNRDICTAGAHGDPQIGGGQRRGIIYAVADHRDPVAIHLWLIHSHLATSRDRCLWPMQRADWALLDRACINCSPRARSTTLAPSRCGSPPAVWSVACTPRRRPIRPLIPTGPPLLQHRHHRRRTIDDEIWDDRAEQDANHVVALLFVAATPLRRVDVAQTLRTSQARLSRAGAVLCADRRPTCKRVCASVRYQAHFVQAAGSPNSTAFRRIAMLGIKPE